MKRSGVLSVILVLGASVAFAQAEPSWKHFSNPLLNDAVRMTKAGLSDATIVDYLRARRARLDSILSADDLIQLRRAGVSEKVVQYFAGAAAVDVGRGAEVGEEEGTYDSQQERAYPVEAYDGDYAYPYGYGFYPPYDGGYFSNSLVFVGGRPFFRRHFFFRRPFFRRPFFRRNVFFGHRFARRPFFPRRGFHGFARQRGSAPIGSRIALPPMRGRRLGGSRMPGQRGSIRSGRMS